MLNYIILAHTNPTQVRRLVERLMSENSFFYIHIDKKVEIEPFVQALSHLENVAFLEEKDRCVGVWGDFSLVEMTLNAIRRILSDERSGYCVLLSGQDYPLRNASSIDSFFRFADNFNFISYGPIPYSGWGPTGGIDRLEYYKIKLSTVRMNNSVMLPTVFKKEFYSKSTFSTIKSIIKSGVSFELLNIFKPRKFPSYLKPYGGDAWWALPMDTIQKIIAFLDLHKDFTTYIKYTKLPDEIFFHSLVVNICTPEKIKPSVTYLKWEQGDVSSPKTFNSKDVDELRKASSTHLFARKLDENHSENLLSTIDSWLLSEQS